MAESTGGYAGAGGAGSARRAARPVVVVAMRVEAVAVGGRPVVVGMGAERAALSGALLSDGLAPDETVVVAGVCGGLDPGLASGTVVLAEAVCRADGEQRRLPPQPQLGRALAASGLAVVERTVVSAERVVRGAARRELARVGSVVDMESAALVEALGGHRVAVVRVVADTPETGMVRGGLVALRVLRRVGRVLGGWRPPANGG